MGKGSKRQEFYDWAYPRALELRREGKRYKEIAAELKISDRTVSGWVKNGRKIHPDTVPKYRLDKAFELLKNGASYLEASQLSGVSDHTLARKFPDYGWTREQSIEHGRQVMQMKRDYDLDKFLK